MGNPKGRPTGTLQERIKRRIVVNEKTGCWDFIGKLNGGYGKIWDTARGYYRGAHLALYEELVGPVPKGKELDHTCRNKACVNPEHLEPVSHLENVRRGSAGHVNRSVTHCPSGHPYEGDNLILTTYRSSDGLQRERRVCRLCRKDAIARHREKRCG